MMRTRQVSVEVAPRETSISLRLSKASLKLLNPSRAPPASPESRTLPAACPVCGAGWICANSHGEKPLDPNIYLLLSAFSQLGLHPPAIEGNRFFVCRQSFERFREPPLGNRRTRASDADA